MIKTFFEIVILLLETIGTLFISMLKAMFAVSDSVDTVKYGFVAAVLGVSIGFVTVVVTIITIVSLIIKILKEVHDN